MKEFESYTPLPEAEIAKLWEDGIIVLDTNVLLDLYRYTEKTRGECLEVIRKVRGQLWIPRQVALEFFRNRPSVISDQVTLLDQARKMVAVLRKHADDELRRLFTFRTHPILDQKAIEKRLTDTLDQIDEDIKKQMESHPDHLKADGILPQIEAILSGKVGAGLSAQDLKKLYVDGKERYGNDIPPGYCDTKGPNKKEGNQVYGDLVVWTEILQKAAGDKKGIIFVTNDGKDDWWWKVRGKTIGCRPELREELRQTANTSLQMYSSELFISYAKEHLNAKVAKKTIDEVKKVYAVGFPLLYGAEQIERVTDKILETDANYQALARRFAQESDLFKAFMARSAQQQKWYDDLAGLSDTRDAMLAALSGLPMTSPFTDDRGRASSSIPPQASTDETNKHGNSSSK